jgi:ribosome biogenesis protein ERB1
MFFITIIIIIIIDIKISSYHHQAIRAVAYHRRYPLFATCSDDGFVHVFHGRVFSDLLQNPLIVPLKRLCSPKNLKSCGINI